MRSAHSPTTVDPQLQKLMTPSDAGAGSGSRSSLNALSAVAAAVTAAGFVAGKHDDTHASCSDLCKHTKPSSRRQGFAPPAAGHA